MTDADFTFVLSIQPPPIEVSYEDLEPTISSLTGRPLRRYNVSFLVAGDARNEEVGAVLAAANDGTELISDTEGGQWRVGHRSVSSLQGSQMYRHHVDLLEQEVLTLTAVEIDGMTLTPERWKTETSGMLTFLVSLDSEENRNFEQILERHMTAGAAASR